MFSSPLKIVFFERKNFLVNFQWDWLVNIMVINDNIYIYIYICVCVYIVIYS